jgi:hypothetical protein
MELGIRFEEDFAVCPQSDADDHACVYLTTDGQFVVASTDCRPAGSRYLGPMTGAEGLYGSSEVLTIGELRSYLEG